MPLPWAAGEAPRFVCDTMTEGLARQLRMFGVDAASVPGGQTAKRHIVYRWCVGTAARSPDVWPVTNCQPMLRCRAKVGYKGRVLACLASAMKMMRASDGRNLCWRP